MTADGGDSGAQGAAAPAGSAPTVLIAACEGIGRSVICGSACTSLTARTVHFSRAGVPAREGTEKSGSSEQVQWGGASREEPQPAVRVG